MKLFFIFFSSISQRLVVFAASEIDFISKCMKQFLQINSTNSFGKASKLGRSKSFESYYSAQSVEASKQAAALIMQQFALFHLSPRLVCRQ